MRYMLVKGSLERLNQWNSMLWTRHHSACRSHWLQDGCWYKNDQWWITQCWMMSKGDDTFGFVSVFVVTWGSFQLLTKWIQMKGTKKSRTPIRNDSPWIGNINEENVFHVYSSVHCQAQWNLVENVSCYVNTKINLELISNSV